MDGCESLADDGTRIASRRDNAALRLWAEMLALFIGMPGLLIIFRHYVSGILVILIMLAACGCWMILKRQPGFDRRTLWNARDFGRHVGRTLLVFVPLGVVAAVISYLYMPGSFFAFPRTHFIFWLLVMVLYPILSAYPQELIYRTFFFSRYRTLFKTDRQLAVASAIVFGWGHVFLGNWIAPLFATLGGLLFGRTWQRSNSLLQTALEHGLWGNLLFTVGIGWYFYAGSIG